MAPRVTSIEKVKEFNFVKKTQEFRLLMKGILLIFIDLSRKLL